MTLITQPIKNPNPYVIPSSLLKRIHRNACVLITL